MNKNKNLEKGAKQNNQKNISGGGGGDIPSPKQSFL